MTKNQILVTPQGNGKVTKAFAKQARIFGTTEFKQWREFLSEFPNAKMIIKQFHIAVPTQMELSLKALTSV